MKKDESGQSLVETALILPILLLLIAGIIDFGRVFYSYSHLHMAAQETVRRGGLGEGDSAISAFAHDYIHLSDSEKLQVRISPTESARNHGTYMTVQLRYPFTFVTPIISKFFPSPFMIETESTIRVE